jgi:uncharacterized membrane protein
MKSLLPTRIAEIIFGCTIGVFGLLHFKSASDAMAMKSVPAYMPGNPSLWIYITGAAFIIIAALIILNKFKKAACYSFAAIMFIFFVTVHLPDLLVNKYNLSQPLKDIGLAMAAIIIGNSSSK